MRHTIESMESERKKRAREHGGWRRFLFAVLALGVSLFVALYATALSQSGHYIAAAVAAVLALAIAGLVAVRTVPYLARRTSFERWMVNFKYEFTREGAVYLGVIAIIAVAALNTGNNLLFIILACLLAGILVSGIFSRIVLENLSLDLALPEHIFAEQALIATITVANGKKVFPSFSVRVTSSEAPSGGRAAAKAPAPSAILNDPIYVPFIPHRAAVAQPVEIKFPRRGRYTQEGFRIATKFPFGFLSKSREIASRRDLLALPSVEAQSELDRVLRHLGAEQETYFKGPGHDLYSIRDYEASDPARHVDWKATAKAQQLKVREFAREDERRLRLIFDNRVSDLSETLLLKFEKGVTLCACVAWRLACEGGQLGLATPESELAMAPGRDVIFPLLEKLAVIEPRLASLQELDEKPLIGDGDASVPALLFVYGESLSRDGGASNQAIHIRMDEL